MQAIVIEEHGGLDKLALQEVPTPVPAPMEVLVRLEAMALNHLDLWVRRGVPGHRFPLPLVPGSDAAGIVDAVGAGVEGLELGAEVVCFPAVSCGRCETCLSGQDQLCPSYSILGEARNGTAAQYVCLPHANIHPKPDNLSFEEAACGLLSFLTAWNMLVVRARLQAYESVLVHAGASGVGSAAIQIAQLLGARVIATAGSVEKCKLAQELGASHVLNYREADFVQEALAFTDGKGVEVVIEHIGGDTFSQSIRALAWGGRLVSCGATTGAKVEVNLARLFFKNLSFLGSTMGSKGDLLKILKLFGEGRLSPVVGKVLHGLDRYPEAQSLLEERKVLGKVVVTTRGR